MRILRGQKFPEPYIVAYYREAQEALSQFLASNMEDYTILDKKINYLEQQPASNIQQTRRFTNNIDAIENF